MKTIPISELVGEMSFGIYHATSLESYRQILKGGRILPGNQIKHKNFPQSRLSNCHELGGVACFDFEKADRNKLFGDDAMMKWPQVLLSYKHSDSPTTVAIGFDRAHLPDKPLYYPEIKKKLGLGGIIPYGIECCYPEPIPLRLCRHIIIVCHWNQTPLSFVIENDYQLSEERFEKIGIEHKNLAEEYRQVLNRKKQEAL
jgi:hypothetical protein